VVQTQYSYEPYGKGTRIGATTTNSQSYTGREDDGTGLYYFRRRYLAAQRGRFVSEDPIGLDGGPNVYAYAYDNPVAYVDPSGLSGFSAAFGGGGAVVGGGSGWTGGYFSPDKPGQGWGKFTSKGTEWGLGYSLGVQFSWFRGNGIDLFCGHSYGYTLTVPLISVGLTYSNGRWSGITVGGGVGLPFGFTVNDSNTTTY
jgi:RHS repeat-associated protein